MDANNPVVFDTFKSLVEGRAFASQVNDRGPDMLASLASYPAALAEEGREKAEHQLVESMRRHASESRRAIYAASIESAAKGILALAKAKGECLTDITHLQPMGTCSVIRSVFGPRRKFLLKNPEDVNLGTWSAFGEIGLQAVILEVGYASGNRETASMALILPAWGKSGNTIRSGTISCLKFYTTGYSTSDIYTFYQATAEGREYVDEPKLAMESLLGIYQPTPRLHATNEGGNIDIIGFPDPEGYFTTKLPELGIYFTTLAEKITARG